MCRTIPSNDNVDGSTERRAICSAWSPAPPAGSARGVRGRLIGKDRGAGSRAVPRPRPGVRRSTDRDVGAGGADRTGREHPMLKNSPFFAGFAVDDLAKAKASYGSTLGAFEVAELSADLLSLRAANGYAVLIQKPEHEPPAHTILNLPSTTSRPRWVSSGARASSSSSMTTDPSGRTRRASPRPDRSRPGSRIRPEVSCP
jgi:hypothetical protein